MESDNILMFHSESAISQQNINYDLSDTIALSQEAVVTILSNTYAAPA